MRANTDLRWDCNMSYSMAIFGTEMPPNQPSASASVFSNAICHRDDTNSVLSMPLVLLMVFAPFSIMLWLLLRRRQRVQIRL